MDTGNSSQHLKYFVNKKVLLTHKLIKHAVNVFILFYFYFLINLINSNVKVYLYFSMFLRTICIYELLA